MRHGLILGSDAFAHGAIPLDDYVADQPQIPDTLLCPHADKYPWGMLGNDWWGDCVEAGMLHADEALYLKRGLQPYPYQSPQALGLYSRIAGFNPTDGPSGSNPTDQGTDPAQAMAYWRDTGFPGHKILGFGQLPGSSPNLRRAIWEFGAVMLAVGLPVDWRSQLTGPTGQAQWSGANHGEPMYGHAIIAVGYTPTLIQIVTWGQAGSIDDPWALAYLEQSFVPLSKDALNKQGIGPAGFNLAQMTSDLGGLK